VNKPDSKSPNKTSTKAEEIAEMEERAEEARQALFGMIFAALKMRGRKLRAPEGSLPLTIIGGFLGSGKTTLLNHLLVSPHGRRLVVLVNDFGRINIDAALVASQTDDMITLSNGCACCAVSADLTNNLIEIAEREPPPEAIVLEASGIAEPNGIIQTALTNPAIRLDGSLVVVDAETMQEFAEYPLTSRLFHNQIMAADLIVLSKVDLMDESQRAEARQWLPAHYPDKRVIEAVNGDVPAELVLGIDSKRDVQAEASTPTDHVHDFESVSFTINEPLDGDRLHAFLEALPEALLRAKGVLNLAEEPSQRTIYQRVGKRWSYTPAEPWGDETPHSSLVFIGPPWLLDESTLEAGLYACRADRLDADETIRE
jgi:G3E family GTPase